MERELQNAPNARNCQTPFLGLGLGVDFVFPLSQEQEQEEPPPKSITRKSSTDRKFGT